MSSTRLTFLGKMLVENLPTWASRVGYPESTENSSEILPPGILPIPLNEAPGESLHGLYCDYDGAPQDFRELASLLKKLLPGGVAALFLPYARISRKQMEKVCWGLGLKIRLYSPASLSFFLPLLLLRRWTGKIQEADRGPGAWRTRLERIFLPWVRLPLGAGFFVLIEKGLPPLASSAKRKFSVVIPAAEEDLPFLTDQILAWDDFLRSLPSDEDAEVLAVLDGGLFTEETARLTALKKRGVLREIRLYRDMGPGERIRTGLLRSSGRRILVDAGRGAVPPREILPLFGPFLKGEAAPAVALGYARTRPGRNLLGDVLEPSFPERLTLLSRRIRAGIRRRLLGAPFPEAEFRLYSRSFAGEIAGHSRMSRARDFALEVMELLRGTADKTAVSLPVNLAKAGADSGADSGASRAARSFRDAPREIGVFAALRTRFGGFALAQVISLAFPLICALLFRPIFGAYVFATDFLAGLSFGAFDSGVVFRWTLGDFLNLPWGAWYALFFAFFWAMFFSFPETALKGRFVHRAQGSCFRLAPFVFARLMLVGFVCIAANADIARSFAELTGLAALASSDGIFRNDWFVRFGVFGAVVAWGILSVFERKAFYRD